jgi:hypothetical protein
MMIRHYLPMLAAGWIALVVITPNAGDPTPDEVCMMPADHDQAPDGQCPGDPTVPSIPNQAAFGR